MNERIRELAKQAGGNPNYKAFRGHFLLPPPDYIDPATVDLEKFAELIIKECADIAKHHVMNISTYADAEFVEEQIGKHFGVEE